MAKKLIIAFTEWSTGSEYTVGRLSTDECMARLNKNLASHSSSPEIVAWFGNQQNLVLDMKGTNIRHSVATFKLCTGLKCAGFPLSEIYWLIHEIILRHNSGGTPSSRKKIGIAFQLEGPRHYFDDFDTERAFFRCVTPGIAAVTRKVCKPEIPQERHGTVQITWTKTSKILRSRLRGEWTSRSIDFVDGIFQQALLVLDRE